jgi:hypothetical protein
MDAVRYYSLMQLPSSAAAPLGAGSIRWIVDFGSPEYIRRPSSFPNASVPPPPWRLPENVRSRVAADLTSILQTWSNIELLQSPAFYGPAGLWLRIGEYLGLSGGTLLYWVRWLNIPIIFGLVWLGYHCASLTQRSDRFVRLATAFLLAVFPQDAFYGISADALSAVAVAGWLAALVQIVRVPNSSLALYLAVGFLSGISVLIKLTNLPVLAISGALAAWVLMRRVANRGWEAPLRGIFLLLVGAVIPIVAWDRLWCLTMGRLMTLSASTMGV